MTEPTAEKKNGESILEFYVKAILCIEIAVFRHTWNEMEFTEWTVLDREIIKVEKLEEIILLVK